MSRNELSWVGSIEAFLDKPTVHQIGSIVVGRYGGNSSAGQYKNEDGCLIWVDADENWEFTMIVDAHNTAESAEQMIELFTREKSQIQKLLLSETVLQTFKKIEEKIVCMFQSPDFLSICRKVQGETACLILVRKDKYIWWFSVGDCLLYLFHPDLAALGQYQVNQRQFYEWIGQVNTFEQEVPCYSTGIRELRKGENRLFLTTDGLVECPNEPFADPMRITESFDDEGEQHNVLSMLKAIQENGVRDSTTILTWTVDVMKEVTMPSDFRGSEK